MSNHIADLKDFLVAQNLTTGFIVQPYELKSTTTATERSIALLPDGGGNASIRQPFVRILLIGQINELAAYVVNAADSIVKKLSPDSATYSQGNAALFEVTNDITISERTTDGRPYCQINLRCLVW